jgi:hypothetical protein
MCFATTFVGHYGTDCAKSLDQEGRPHLLQGTSYATRAKVREKKKTERHLRAVGLTLLTFVDEEQPLRYHLSTTVLRLVVLRVINNY